MSLKVWPWYCCDLLCMCRTHNFRFHHDCIQNLYIHCGVYTRMHNFLSFFQGWSMIFRFHPNSMICVWIHNHILYRRWDLTKVNMSTNYFETRYNGVNQKNIFCQLPHVCFLKVFPPFCTQLGFSTRPPFLGVKHPWPPAQFEVSGCLSITLHVRLVLQNFFAPNKVLNWHWFTPLHPFVPTWKPPVAVKVSGTYLQNIAGSASNHKMKETHNSIRKILTAITHPIIEFDIG